MRQDEINGEIALINNRRKILREELRRLEYAILGLNTEANQLDDPHVLIPKQHNKMEEWLVSVSCPELVRSSHTFKNYNAAFYAQITSSVYSESYHIKRI